MILQSLRKHQITRSKIHLWNSSRLRWLLTVAVTLGMSPFVVAENAATSTDPFLAQSASSAQTWEELKSRSAEKRWESLSRESKRELKKQDRKERREQRKLDKNSDEFQVVPEFRQIPDEIPTASAAVPSPSSTEASIPAPTGISTSVTDVVPSAEPFKTIGLEEKQPGASSATTNLDFNTGGPVSSTGQTGQVVPIFPTTVGSSSDFVTTQKAYENAAASPGSDDLKYAGEELEDEVPHLLKKIADIKPFFDYEPDPEIAKNEPCRNLCPRPDGKPCKLSEQEGQMVMECPKVFQLSHQPYAGRNFTESIYTWEASNVNYNPLYFEDPNLERYGNSRKDLVQPFVSMGRFTGQLLALPYQMSIDPLRKKIYPLGYYRPGEYTPKRINGIPWNTKAAFTQGLTTTGLIFLLP